MANLDLNRLRMMVQRMIEENLLRFAYGSGSGPSATNVVTNVFNTIGGIKSGDAANGDLEGTYPNPSVKDDSHNHTSATLPATMPPSAHTLDSHSNVNIATPSDGEVLKYQSATAKWINSVGGSSFDLPGTIHAATSKTTPVDADETALTDSTSSFGLKKLTWANVKATLKTYFDTLYALTGHAHTGIYEPANANIQAHISSTSNPHATTAAQVGADITTSTTHAATSKTTPVDADELPILDSAATFGLKKVTWANVKATLKTYFDTLYAAVGHAHAQLHNQSHALDSTSDHTIGGLTSGYLVKSNGTKLAPATNTDAQVSSAVTNSHARQHAITSTADHTSTATSGQMLKADASGLPINATNTDTQVSSAVSASHARAHTLASTFDHSDAPASVANGFLKRNFGNTAWEEVGYGSGANTVTQGNDARLSDARTPTAHATSHKHGGSDEVSTATPAANAIPKADASGKLDAWITDATTSVKGKVLLAANGDTTASEAVQSNDYRMVGAVMSAYLFLR